MLRRLSIALFATLACSGCQQSRLVFVSGQTIGFKVGANAQEIPMIQVGYDQIDAVEVPLAMDGRQDGGGSNGSGTGSICAQAMAAAKAAQGTPPAQIRIAPDALEVCKFVASDGTDRIDGYSVYGRFNAKVDAKSQVNAGAGGSASAGLQLGKVFATGMAAQLLADHASGGPEKSSALRLAAIDQINKIAATNFEKTLKSAVTAMSGNGYKAEASAISSGCTDTTAATPVFDRATCSTFVSSANLSDSALTSLEFNLKSAP